jgi:uncharacterized repeat protein (TIGR03803 family)
MMNKMRERVSRTRVTLTMVVLALVAALAFGVMATPSAHGQTLTVLYDFGSLPDAENSYANLIRDSLGNLYGTTVDGGAYGLGTVFKLEPSGAETVLHSFAGGSTDGQNPYGGLVRDTSGNLYGMTYQGGALNLGTIFKVDASGTETLLHSFAGGAKDGALPLGGLVLDKSGNLYGAVQTGGVSDFGVVIELSNGSLKVLHSFAGGPSDGEYPYYTTLHMDTKGNLYGVTFAGGTNGFGVVYELKTSGNEALLYSFAGGTTDGCYPVGVPVSDADGNLYGTTNACGPYQKGAGAVWKLNQARKEKVLHFFAGGPSDGTTPYSGVVLDKKGNLYGDTLDGGADNFGVAYMLTKTSTMKLLHSFAANDGEFTGAALLRDAKGNLYGTAESGGTNYGTVWKLAP